MKTYEEIDQIITDMSDELFQKILDDEFDAWDLDRRVAKNGRARFLRDLAKAGLTEAEWDEWSNH